jgi:hypothetical protein
VDLLGAGDGGSRSWHSLLWHQWVAALRAEAAVLAREPGAARHLAQAKAHADRNPIAGALTPACRSAPAGTLILARNGERAAGEGELARIGATPMAAFR